MGNLLSQEGLCHPRQETANMKHKKRTRFKSKRGWRPSLFLINLIFFIVCTWGWGGAWLHMCDVDTRGPLPVSFRKSVPLATLHLKNSLSLTWSSSSRLSYLANEVPRPNGPSALIFPAHKCLPRCSGNQLFRPAVKVLL